MYVRMYVYSRHIFIFVTFFVVIKKRGKKLNVKKAGDTKPT